MNHTQDKTALKYNSGSRQKLMEKGKAMLESNSRLEWVWLQTEKEGGGRDLCDRAGVV